MRKILFFYNHLLNRYKYPVQIVSGGVLWFTGDILSQLINDYRGDQKLQFDGAATRIKTKSLGETEMCSSARNIDWKRAATMTVYGMTVSAPLYTFWYSALDRWTHVVFKSSSLQRSAVRSPWRTWKIIGFKLAADTFVFDPVYLGIFFTATNLMEGKSLSHTLSKLRRDFLWTYCVDVAVWFPIQTFNFRFASVLYQPLVVQTCNIGWNAYLSYVQHRNSQHS